MQIKKQIEADNIPIEVITAGTSQAPSAIDLKKLRLLLNEKGVVLLRGFNFDLENLENFTHGFCHEFHAPATRSARRVVKGDSYSTEVFPHNYSLLGHTEGSYRPNKYPPEICFFMCVIPPIEAGGETTLTDGVEFLARLPHNIRERFEKAGITYEMYWEKERWQNEFMVNDVKDLELFLNSMTGVKYKLNNEDLHLFYTTPAISNDRTGKQVFATALLAHLPQITHPVHRNNNSYSKPSNRVYFGDGEEISDETINQLIDIHDEIAYPHRWHKKDTVVIDNTRYLHGRRMTERDCERVLVSRFGRFK